MSGTLRYSCTVLVFILGIASSDHTCWTNLCTSGEDFCVQECLDDEKHCLANYVSHSDGTISAALFGCIPEENDACDVEACVAVGSEGGVFSCCCTGDLCNEIQGLTPGSTVTDPSFTTSIPTGTIPVRPPNHQICEFYNCSLVTDPTTQSCYHGYEVCAETSAGMAFDHDDHYCQALYQFNSTKRLYELYTKSCQYGIPRCADSDECFIDTDRGDAFLQCCCDGQLCNVNVTFSDPSRVVPGEAPECGGLDCDHSCIIMNGEPRCFCEKGFFLSDEDQASCVDVNECSTGAHLCEEPATCVNEVGTYRCECDATKNMRISDDGLRCEPTGLVCEKFECDPQGDPNDCLGGLDYCDDRFLEDEMIDFDDEHCQATYQLDRVSASLEPRLLTCQIGTQIGDCTHGYCNLRYVSADVLYCCCTGNLCNLNITFPETSETPPTHSPEPSPSPTTTPTITQESKTKEIITFASALSVVVFLIIIVIIIALIWYQRRYKRRQFLNAGPDPYGYDIAPAPVSPFMTTVPTLLNKIGRGKFAVVFKGKLPDRYVAIKCFEDSPQGRDSFQRELEMYQTPDLSHHNILQFLGYQTLESRCCIVFEYHAQGSLCDLLKQQTVTLQQFCDLAESAASGLAYLHNEKIVNGVTKKPAIAHRDLKSKNILVTNSGRCCISDLGLAIRLDHGENSNEAHGQVGTSRYMAPEVLEGAINFQREAFLRIDVYAFGLILYEICSRTALANANVKPYRPPFDEFVSSNPTIDEMTTVVVQEQRRPEIPICFHVDLELDTIRETIQEAWDQDAEARLSAQCIEERIRKFRSSYVGKAGPIQVSKSHEDISKDSGRETDSQVDPFSQLPDTPSLSSSVTMSPLEPKPGASPDPLNTRMGFTNIAMSNETMAIRHGGNCNENQGRRPYHLHCGHSTETTV